ncbi:NUDIX hydrolase domain-like protein [Schizophyllum fasciatum]
MADVGPLSFLDLVDRCDVFRPGAPSKQSADEELLPFHLTPAPDSPKIGLLRPVIVDALRKENDRQPAGEKVWEFLDAPERVSLALSLNTPAKRSAAMRELAERWRDEERFPDVCGPRKWRGELYPVYADPFARHDYPSPEQWDTPDTGTLNFVFDLERSACALFGIVTYGVHMSAFEESAGGQLRIWVPTRAKTKQTWPGYLDNSVAGGIPSGMSPWDSLVKECMEEASIAADVVQRYCRCTGAISYFYRTTAGWLQPEVEYTYDLRIPTGADPELFKPKPLDGEVESFEFLTQDEVIAKMRAGLFKYNCATAFIDLFIRMGFVTPENEPNFLQIVTRLHGRFDMHKW